MEGNGKGVALSFERNRSSFSIQVVESLIRSICIYIYIFLKGRIEDQKWKIIHPSIRDTFMGRGIPRRRDRQAYHSRRVGEGIPRRIFVRIGSNDASINPLRNPSLDFRGSRFARYIASNSD